MITGKQKQYAALWKRVAKKLKEDISMCKKICLLCQRSIPKPDIDEKYISELEQDNKDLEVIAKNLAHNTELLREENKELQIKLDESEGWQTFHFNRANKVENELMQCKNNNSEWTIANDALTFENNMLRTENAKLKEQLKEAQNGQ